MKQINNTIQKKTRFHYIRDIIIVPTKEEYLEHSIWWEEQDYVNFRQSAINEILSYKKFHSSLNLNQALAILYNNGNNIITTPIIN